MKLLKFSLVAFSLAFTLVSCEKDVDAILNKPPKVNAGPDQVIEEVITEFELSGSASDSDGVVLAYQWVQLDGPGNATIIYPGKPKATVKGITVGTYKFQLLATDEDGATGVDTVNVTVKKVSSVTETLHPFTSNGDIQLLDWYTGNGRNNTGIDIPLVRWTDGSPVTARNVLRFDLTNIPANAKLVSAKLHLYSYPVNPINGNKVDPNYGGDNSFLVQRISDIYDPATISWFNQPSLTAAGQVLVPHTNDSRQDLVIDVKDMTQEMISNGNYGFHLKLKTEVMFTSRIFVSSHNATYPNLAPKLVVEYK